MQPVLETSDFATDLPSSKMPGGSNSKHSVPCRHNGGAANNRSSCNLCNLGAYKLKQQNHLHIQFDRLNSMFKQGASTNSVVEEQDTSEGPLAVLGSSSQLASDPSSFLRVVHAQYTDSDQLQQSVKFASDTKSSNVSSKKKQSKKQKKQTSSVELESNAATFHNRDVDYSGVCFPSTPAVWEPGKRVVYSKSGFSQDSQGHERFSRLARSPASRHVSAKLVQIEMAMPPELTTTVSTPAGMPRVVQVKFADLPAVQHEQQPQQPVSKRTHIPACFTAANNLHDILPHNPSVNYFKIKQLVEEGKLKLKHVPASEWVHIFQPPTSTVGMGDGECSEDSAGLPMARGELVNNWVRKAEMQPLTKFTHLKLDGLGELSSSVPTSPIGSAEARATQIISQGELVSQSATTGNQSSSHVLQSTPANGGFLARSSGYLANRSRKAQRTKQPIQDNGFSLGIG